MIGRRRALLALVGLGATGWMPGALAQRLYRVAVLTQGSERTQGARFEALRAGLRELGYVEGKNLSLLVRWNEGSLDRLPELAAELLREKPDVFVTAPVLTTAAVHKLTRTVPIVMASGAGAIRFGMVRSLAHPGGNVTGLTNQIDELTEKQIELLKAIVPGLSRLGVLNTGKSAAHEDSWRGAQQAAQALKLKLVEVRVDSSGDLPRIASLCGKGGCQGLLVQLDPQLVNWRAQIVRIAAQLRLPAMYFAAEFVQEGGLVSYASSGEDLWRRAAGYVDKILKGAQPADLPIEQPLKFELVVNLKTAKALGVTIPQTILLRADRVIE